MKPFVQQLYKTIQSESVMNVFVVPSFIFNLATLKTRSFFPIAVAYTWIGFQGLEGIVNGLRSGKLQYCLHNSNEKPAARHKAASASHVAL